MGNHRADAAGRQLETLWSVGWVGDLEDDALLARYDARRDGPAEAAFRVLVERHGPMVLRTCRQILGDDHDAQDAAQAVFLILARKAGSLRGRDSVAPWLHGVARRVASRARKRTSARRVNEERAARVAAAQRGEAVVPADPAVDWEVVHREVDRLPEKYRTPVVLCYLEGRTYEDAARRIGCPVGTVRVRLSRARDRLRDRLRRRGYGPTAVASTLAPGPSAGPGTLGRPSPVRGAGAPVETLSVAWVEATVRAARTFASGGASASGPVSAAVLSLSQGVIRSMLMSKLTTWALGLLTLGVVAAGAGARVGQEAGLSKPEGPAHPVAVREEPGDAGAKGAEAADEAGAHLSRRITDAARRRLESQLRDYEKGRITLDRFIEASRQVALAETEAATTHEGRVAAAKAHLARLEEVERRERSELEVGRGTVADVAEAELAKERAEQDVRQALAGGSPGDLMALERRIGALERKLDRVLERLDRPARGSTTGAEGAAKPPR